MLVFGLLHNDPLVIHRNRAGTTTSATLALAACSRRRAHPSRHPEMMVIVLAELATSIS
jgi:hypothetical protein